MEELKHPSKCATTVLKMHQFVMNWTLLLVLSFHCQMLNVLVIDAELFHRKNKLDADF